MSRKLRVVKTVVYEGIAAEQRLKQLGLDAEGFALSVEKGEYARAEATDNDPLGAAGYDAYRYRIRALREYFCPRGWHKHVEDGLEMIVADEGARAVITRAGDSGVGDSKAFPQPQRAVGESTESAVNTGKLAFDPSWFNKPTEATKKEMDVYMLLVHRSGDIVKSELSLPTKVDERGRVEGWEERIILSVLDLNSEPEKGTVPNQPTPSETIDVPVIRKK